jgi:hypothetical protein
MSDTLHKDKIYKMAVFERNCIWLLRQQMGYKIRRKSHNANLYVHFLLRNTGRFIMYSGITKIYYRKTVGHVFTKQTVQIEGTTQIFFPPS